jgi:hypothetical protein
MQNVYAVDIGTAFPGLNKFADFGALVNTIVSNAVMIAGIITFFLLIIGALGIILGAGSSDPKRMEQGSKTLTSAIIGFVVIIAAVWIVQILQKLTGINIMQPTQN